MEWRTLLRLAGSTAAASPSYPKPMSGRKEAFNL
jgi:hypothetical protein